MAAIAVLWGVLTIATSLIPGAATSSVGFILVSLITVRFLVGMVHAPVFPVINCSIERWFPMGGWALPTGLCSTGLTLGFAAAAPVLVWMIAQWGWRTAFFALAPLGFVSALLWWWYSRDRPGQHPSVNPVELAQIRAGRSFGSSTASPEAQAAEQDVDWKQLLKNRDILLLTTSHGCMNFVFYDAFNWFFYYLVTVREFSAAAAALFGWTFAMALGGIFALLGAGLMLLVRADRPFYADAKGAQTAGL